MGPPLSRGKAHFRDKNYSGAFMLSTLEIFFRRRPMTRLTTVPNSSVSTSA